MLSLVQASCNESACVSDEGCGGGRGDGKAQCLRLCDAVMRAAWELYANAPG